MRRWVIAVLVLALALGGAAGLWLAARPSTAAYIVPGATDVRVQELGPGARSITYDAMGWRMAERATNAQLLPGDTLDVAFSVSNNDHAEFGGLELTLCDFVPTKAAFSQ